MTHKMRDFNDSKFQTTIGIEPSYKQTIKDIKGKKSMAGKLRDIIDFYLEKKEYKTMIEVYTDGSTVGKNGKLGTVSEVGLGIYIPELDVTLAKRVLGISNNEAEFKALILAMEIIIEKGIDNVRFNMDSKIVCNRAYGKKPKTKYANERMDNFQLKVLSLRKKLKNVEFRWIPRERNLVADELSNQAKAMELEDTEELYQDELSQQYKAMF